MPRTIVINDDEFAIVIRNPNRDPERARMAMIITALFDEANEDLWDELMRRLDAKILASEQGL